MVNSKLKHGILCATAFISLMVSGWSCRTQKNVTAGKEQASLQTALLETLNCRSIDTKLSMEVSSYQVNGQLKSIQDSSLWLSVQFMGMEFARLTLTPTELQIISRPQKFSCQSGTEMFPYALQCLQGILMHRIVVPGIQNPTLQDFTVENREDGGWNLVRRESSGTFSYHIDKEIKLVQTDIDINGTGLSATYSSFDEGFPTVVELAETGGRMAVRVTYNHPEINRQPNIRLEVPSGYRKVSLQEMFRSFSL